MNLSFTAKILFCNPACSKTPVATYIDGREEEPLFALKSCYSLLPVRISRSFVDQTLVF